MKPTPALAARQFARCAGAAAALFVGFASPAQTPNLQLAPINVGNGYTYCDSISSDGRYVSGRALYAVSGAESIFRWDTLASTAPVYITSSGAIGGVSPVKTLVTEDGARVFWVSGYNVFNAPSRINLWTPSNNANSLVTSPSDPNQPDYFSYISRDGLYLMGSTAGFPGEGTPIILDFTFQPPMRQLLSPGDGNTLVKSAGITNSINGARFAYGTVSGNGQRTGMNWIVPNPTPMNQNWEVIRVTPAAAHQIGRIGSTYYLFGDGAGRLLAAPTSPFLMSDPIPAELSDDGSTVVGTALHPFGYRQAVLWRKGYAPATLETVLASAGISTANWSASTVHAVSSDGSVIVGEYYDQQSLHGFRAVLPAANDSCSSPRPVTYGTTISSTNGATRAGVSGTCANESTAPDIWFSFVPLTNETVTIDTCGSNFDTTLAIYSGTCASLGNPLACNDDASPACSSPNASRIALNVFGGQTYLIRVSGFNGTYGTVNLTITAPNRPANDSCAQATDVAPGTGVPFNNANAITDSRPPCGGTPFNDVWFRSVAPENGRMTFSTCGSTINTVMNVYDSSACGDLNAVPLACGSSNAGCQIIGGGNGTRITVPCTAGQIFLIRVGGLFGSSGGGTFSSNFACDQNDLSAYNVAVLNTQPLDYYRFDDSGALTAADARRFDAYSCGDNRGQYVGPVNRPGSYQGRALDLHGDGAHARVWGPTPITTQCSSATVEAWVNTRDPLAGVVFTNRNAPAETSLTMVIGYNTIGLPGTEGRVMFIADGPGNFHGAISNQRVDDGRWHHVVGRRILSGISRYSYDIAVDGVSSSLNNLPGVGTAQSGADGTYWLIGNGTAWPTDGAAFNGKIDEVAVYCGSLPPQTIIDHYNIGKPCLADINYDHVVDFFDYLDFVEAFDTQGQDADFNRDNVIDFFDYLDFLTAFTGPC